MYDAHGNTIAVDVLEDVDLAASRPLDAVAVRLAHKPERRPDALLLILRRAANEQLAFETCNLSWGRREGVLGLDAAAGPFAGLAVLLGNDLQALAGVLKTAPRDVSLALV